MRAQENIMRILKIMLTTFILGGLLAVPTLGCTPESESAVSETQIVTAERGDLTIDIAAAGNLALSLQEDLAFEMSGTVEAVLVEEGETVEERQVLATLDTSEWESELRALEGQVTTKERDLLQAEMNVINAELALEKAEDAWLDTVSAGTTVRRLEERLEWYLENEPEEVEKIREIREDLEKAWSDFSRVASNSVDAREVTAKEMGSELAQAQLEDAKEALEEAQEELEEALENSPEVIAPFDGFITKVNVEGGDEVLKGTVAVQLADPHAFEADILVSEMDILQVELGGEAWVQVDAMQGLTLLAKVIHISPTATIQSGVVNYQVKVEVQSLETVMQERQQEGQKAMQDTSSGELPERLKQAVEAGQITREQAEEMMKQRQQVEQQGQVPTAMLEDFQLREGLTVTVSIIVDERNDVLLVPNAAITSSVGQTYVHVMSPDGISEERSIQTGISNWQYTEVTDGISEGEEVIIPQGTSTTSTTSQQGPPGGMIIPGMRPPHD
jgi:multidrug efflux pump subunit AcrA (membrane-fusion protein)